MAREYFCAYHSMLGAMRRLSDAECGRLFRALLMYSEGEMPDNLQGREELLFDVFSQQIDRDAEKYENSCKKNRENVTKRYDRIRPYTSEYERIRANTTVYETYQDKDKEEEEEDKDKDNGAIAPIAPPRMGEALTDAEIRQALAADEQIQSAAMDFGLPVNPGNMVLARDLAAQYTLDWLIEAIRRAGSGKSQTWGYVQGILRNWGSRGGIDDPKAARAAAPGKTVSAQCYGQRAYTEEELSGDATKKMLEEARMLRES